MLKKLRESAQGQIVWASKGECARELVCYRAECQKEQDQRLACENTLGQTKLLTHLDTIYQTLIMCVSDQVG